MLDLFPASLRLGLAPLEETLCLASLSRCDSARSSLMCIIMSVSAFICCCCLNASWWKRPPPPMASSSSQVPSSTILPCFTTAILLHPLIVVSRCAIVTVVCGATCMILSRASWTIFSLVLSRAEVASSKRSTEGFLIIARAIATRCFCPPDNLPPP
mmetsp:Transcript_17814/g.44781  ORF Transcript_17814/g.44781 Transcript_17814/m.44781 type:complete len:157 (-) Transcript_17814:24-494(-)